MTSTYLNFPKRQNYSNSNHSDDEFRFAGENISSIPTNRHDNGPNIISENLPNDVRVERKKKVEWKCQAVGVQFVQYQWMKDFKVRQKKTTYLTTVKILSTGNASQPPGRGVDI